MMSDALRDGASVAAVGLELLEDITVGDALRRAARRTPDMTALKEGLSPDATARRWSYAELLGTAERVGRAMLEYADPGEKVAVWANNAPEWVLVQMGAALAGMTLVTVNPALRIDEARYILHQSEAVMAFHLDRYRTFDMAACLEQLNPELPALRQTVLLSDLPALCRRGNDATLLPSVSPDDVAQIQFTSGTTGRPKGAALRHRGIANSAALAIRRNLGLKPGDPLVHAMPLFHTAGSVLMVLGCIQAGATNVMMPDFDPGLQLSLIESERSVVFGGVATMLRAMLAHSSFGATDLSSVRAAIAGGAMVEPTLAREVESRLRVPLSIVYGQTETSAVITMTAADDDPEDRHATVGRPLPGVEVRIVDPVDKSSVMALGQVGEVCTRGQHVMAGYHDDPEKTGQTIDAQGWLHTGDLAFMDERGYLHLEGRLNDMIIRGGENIYPAEIEAALVDHPRVAEAAVVGVPDSYWGERIVAFVRPAPGAPPASDELQTFLAQRLAPHKIPREWHYVKTWPLNAVGKILKTELIDEAIRSASS